MGRDFFESSLDTGRVFDTAVRTLGRDFLDHVFHGVEEELRNTRIAQPALVTIELAIVAHLTAAGVQPDVVAGHSVGELAALAAAGCFSVEDAIRLADARGRAMSENAPEGGMAAVMGMEPSAIELVLPPDVEIANFNGPAQTIISGTKAGLEAARETLERCGARRLVTLNVSGPFHSSLMKTAADRFKLELHGLRIAPPCCTFISSVSGRPESDPRRILELLGAQIESPVRWTDVMTHVPPGEVLETGPGGVLQGIARRIEGGPRVHLSGTFAQAQKWIGARKADPA
jgi:[acyl-carrier-protein] S-malonyltransferase